MTMIRFTYDSGENIATVVWTPEYGFIASGHKVLLSNITYEEVEPKTVDVPVLNVPMRTDVPTAVPEVTRCFACGHPWHTEECTRKVEGLPCGCSTAVA